MKLISTFVVLLCAFLKVRAELKDTVLTHQSPVVSSGGLFSLSVCPKEPQGHHKVALMPYKNTSSQVNRARWMPFRVVINAPQHRHGNRTRATMDPALLTRHDAIANHVVSSGTICIHACHLITLCWGLQNHHSKQRLHIALNVANP